MSGLRCQWCGKSVRVAIRLFEGCPVVCNDCFEELDVMLGLLENMPRQVAR